MTDNLRYVLLGLGSGGIYALLGLGLVVIYRGSGVINFAHAGFAMVGAYLTYQFELDGMSTWPSLVLAVAITAVLGVATHFLVMRPLRTASPLARVIATLGLLTVLTQAIELNFGSSISMVPTPLPTSSLTLGSSIQVGRYNFWLTGIAVVATLILTILGARTRIGYAITASAENTRGAAALGWAPDLLASVTWGIGGGLAAFAGGLFPATTLGAVSPTPFSILIVGALATALLGGFNSYPLALVGGLFLGSAQSLAGHWTNQTGVAASLPFLAIIVVLVLRGRGLPLRGTLADKIPRVGTGRIHVVATVVVAAAALVWIAVGAPTTWYIPVIVSCAFALIGLSIVVLTGYTGQLSLAQFALAGIGAFAAGRLVVKHGWPFELALAAGVVAAMAIGLVFGLPALRTRGVNLAVVTFGLGFGVHQMVFMNTAWSASITPGNITFFGIDVEPIDHARNYALLSLSFLIVAALAVANLRRGRSGRRLLAVRTNERAAAALGVNVFQTKLYAFVLSAGIAGLGGVLLGFSTPTIPYSDLFAPDGSISALMLTVIGGVGNIIGPFIGSLLTPDGLISLTSSNSGTSPTGWQQYIPLATAVILILVLIVSQHGIAERLNALAARVPMPGKGRRRTSLPAAGTPQKVTPRTLTVTGLTQKFGSVTALSNVALEVRPGEVVGLLGPNGAGKTTLIDCISGTNKLTAGTMTLDGKTITRWGPHRCARAGLSRSFQSLELFDDLTVRENLLAAADSRDYRAYATDLVWPGRAELPPAVLAAVSELDLAAVLDTRTEDLSYGQRRLVAIARAVAGNPSVLMLDEPAAGLDETESAELGRLIRRLADEWGMGILLIEHDVALVLRNADRVVVLDFGSKIAEGTPAEIRTNAEVRKAYLGEDAVAGA